MDFKDLTIFAMLVVNALLCACLVVQDYKYRGTKTELMRLLEVQRNIRTSLQNFAGLSLDDMRLKLLAVLSIVEDKHHG